MKMGEEQKVLYISVKYEEFKPETYDGIIVSDSNGDKKIFNTGNFRIDYNNAIHYTKNNCDLSFSMSSVEHFIMDSDNV